MTPKIIDGVQCTQVAGNTNRNLFLTCVRLFDNMVVNVTKVCVTINNYTNAGYESLKRWCIANCKYTVIGKEVGESGTPHLQCFFILKKRMRVTTLNTAITNAAGKAPHTEVARGSNDEAADYCKKRWYIF